jgi:hypothetical protein
MKNDTVTTRACRYGRRKFRGLKGFHHQVGKNKYDRKLANRRDRRASMDQ